MISEKIRYVDDEIATLKRECAVWSKESPRLNELTTARDNLVAERDELDERWRREKKIVLEILELQEHLGKQFLLGELESDSESKKELAKRRES